MALVDQEDLENGQWVSVSQNAYGAFIHVALQSGLLRACSMCLPMVGVSVFVQLVFSIQLFDVMFFEFDESSDVRRRLQRVCIAMISLRISKGLQGVWQSSVEMSPSMCSPAFEGSTTHKWKIAFLREISTRF